ncbi:MAG TPA: PLD nuclease N-terminal domain-containing protein [Kribbella sp.]|nr:PLD nuclease N-terminal domain-containing protein [Kribbella sp.]
MSDSQRAALVTTASVQLALAVSAWTDLARRPASRVNGSKRLWALVIAVNFIGPLAYFRWGRKS